MPGNARGPSYEPGPHQDHPGAEIIFDVDDSGSPPASPCWLPEGGHHSRELTALVHILHAARRHPDSPHAAELLAVAVAAVRADGHHTEAAA
jgi:hypothetical protein